MDWSDIRVICIAPNYKRYDIHAVQVIGANIELWKYRLFENSTLYLEEVFQQAISTSPTHDEDGKNPVMVTAGKKAAYTRATATYTLDQHLQRGPEHIQRLVLTMQEYIMNLDPAFEEVPKQNYIAYKISQNIVCVEVQRRRLLLFLKLNPDDVSPLPSNARDMRGVGHFGTGELELAVFSEADVDVAKALIEMAYQRIGG